jgi:predicted transcriptional regulator
VVCPPARDQLGGFEWCINAPAIDKNGVVYANSEDGYVYAIHQQGTVHEAIFQDEALGAAYTPLAIDAVGRILTMNHGQLTIIGQ